MWLCLFAATQQHDQELGHLQVEAIYAILYVQSTRACVGNTASKEIFVALNDLVQGAASTCPPLSTLHHCTACMSLIGGWRNFAKRQRPGAPCVGSANKHGYAATGNYLHIHVFPMSLSLHASAMLQRWSAICRQFHLQAAMPSPSDMLVAFAFLFRGHAQTHMQNVPYPHPAGPSRPDTLPDGSNTVPARNNVVRATLALWAGKRMHSALCMKL